MTSKNFHHTPPHHEPVGNAREAHSFSTYVHLVGAAALTDVTRVGERELAIGHDVAEVSRCLPLQAPWGHVRWAEPYDKATFD